MQVHLVRRAVQEQQWLTGMELGCALMSGYCCLMEHLHPGFSTDQHRTGEGLETLLMQIADCWTSCQLLVEQVLRDAAEA